MNPDIVTTVSYCTNDYRFIQHVLEEARKFSVNIVVSTCDCFFASEPENRSLLNATYDANPDIRFVEFSYIPELSKYGPRFWICFSRWTALREVRREDSMVLFLDGDEVVDGKRFCEWLGATDLTGIDSVKFLNYWYFREANLRATEVEDSVPMIRKKLVKPGNVFTDSERHALVDHRHLSGVTGLDGNPMIHHYSWVRTREEMLRKVENSGHKFERNWAELVEEEFSRPFSGRDFVHNYTFDTVTPFKPISVDDPEHLPGSTEGGRRLNPNVFYLDVAQTAARVRAIEEYARNLSLQ